ncbi:tyrosine-type recombinase/integrase [Photobacterium toruni]|uniref:tyrosine-type recombinase/integrase n=1 Tax=Photobacterium toruni TaxID=1935446 RepID=UPI00211045D4|nr:tyrosine-type recombinase/integrase [Photobacterium toruni]
MNANVYNREKLESLYDHYELIPTQLNDLYLDPSDFEVEQITKAVEKANELGIPIYKIPHIAVAVEVLLRDFLNHGSNHRTRSIKRLNDGWRAFVNFFINQDKWKNHSYIPANPKAVCDYIEYRYNNGIHRNTLKLELWAIRAVHRATGMPDPTMAKSVESATGKFITKQVLNERFIKQATPLGYDAITLLLQKWRYSYSITTRRNLAFIVMAYEGLFRYSEIASIKMEHLKVRDDGSLLVTLPITKTNHSGDPDVVVLSKHTRNLIEEYMSLANISYKDKSEESPYLFKAVSAWGKEIKYNNKILMHNSIMTLLKNAHNTVYQGLDKDEIPKVYTSHSMRVGAAQDMFKHGIELSRIMKAGRWLSPSMPMRYGRGYITDGATAEILYDLFEM